MRTQQALDTAHRVSGYAKGRSPGSRAKVCTFAIRAFPCARHSGFVRTDNSPTVAGAAPEWADLKTDRAAPDSRFNRRLAPTVTSGGAESTRSCARMWDSIG
jgi:hypothetical protein